MSENMSPCVGVQMGAGNQERRSGAGAHERGKNGEDELLPLVRIGEVVAVDDAEGDAQRDHLEEEGERLLVDVLGDQP